MVLALLDFLILYQAWMYYLYHVWLILAVTNRKSYLCLGYGDCAFGFSQFICFVGIIGVIVWLIND